MRECFNVCIALYRCQPLLAFIRECYLFLPLECDICSQNISTSHYWISIFVRISQRKRMSAFSIFRMCHMFSTYKNLAFVRWCYLFPPLDRTTYLSPSVTIAFSKAVLIFFNPWIVEVNCKPIFRRNLLVY